MLATENHRHFALRDPKGLRISNRFLLNYGPFLDEWGIRLVKEGLDEKVFDDGSFREIVEGLVSGWARLNARSIYASQGYARALYGVISALPKGRTDLESYLSPTGKKTLLESGLRTLFALNRNQFENQWMRKLLTELSTPAVSNK